MKLTLSILDNATPTPNLVSLVIRPNTEHNRSNVSFLKLGTPTATGITTIEGVTARPDLFVWMVKARIKEWELLKLRRMIRLQNARYASSPSTAYMNLKDEYERVNSEEYNKNGRTAVSGSELTYQSETSYFCNFNVFAEIPEQGTKRLNAHVGQLGTVELTLMLMEVV